ncbi:MAG: hypothetical protein K2X01_04350 [Cyanobacteria bacterium]|nr:hypothetical protein [Cyanobacteriota bacterium]
MAINGLNLGFLQGLGLAGLGGFGGLGADPAATQAGNQDLQDFRGLDQLDGILLGGGLPGRNVFYSPVLPPSRALNGGDNVWQNLFNIDYTRGTIGNGQSFQNFFGILDSNLTPNNPLGNYSPSLFHNQSTIDVDMGGIVQRLAGAWDGGIMNLLNRIIGT